MFPLSTLDEVIEVGDVGLVVFSVVVVEGFYGDQLAETVLVVWEVGKGETHLRYFGIIKISDRGRGI